jgi:hypothetical protein
MNNNQVVLITDNLLDYAVVAAAHVHLAERLDARICYPVLLSAAQRPRLELLLRYYGVRPVELASLFRAGDPVGRSQEIDQAYRAADRPAVVVSPSAALASPAELARALGRALAQGQPLTLADSAAVGSLQPDHGTAPRKTSAGRLLIAQAGSELAIPAALYAKLAGKELWLVESLEDEIASLSGQSLSSVIVVADFRVFSKPFLHRLAQLGQRPAAPSAGAGVLTAFSVNELSSLIWRLLTHRYFHEQGGRSGTPEGPGRIPLKEMKPLEYYIVNEHGNERHIQHGDVDVVCGAFPPELKRDGTDRPAFDCEIDCPYAGRVRSSDIPVHNLLVLSCDTATLGDGIAPPEYNVLLNFLNGWCTGIVAPLKHAQINTATGLLAGALLRSGFSLGEIAQRLNSIAPLGVEPDHAYVVIGDPDVVPHPGGRPSPEVVRITDVDGAVDIECSPVAGPLLECTVELQRVARMSTTPVVVPISKELQAMDVHFAFRTLPGARELSILIFSARDLPDVPLHIQLRSSTGVGDAQKHRAAELVRKVRNLVAFGLDPMALQRATEDALAELRVLAGYPRPVEFIMRETVVSHLDEILDARFESARHEILKQVILMMAKGGVWISHKYKHLYPVLRHLPAAQNPESCRACSNHLTVWRYEDNCTDLVPRDVVICPHCGIAADYAVPKDIDVEYELVPAFTQQSTRQRIWFRNGSGRRIEFSAFLQVNAWESQRVAVDPIMVDVVLLPDELEVSMDMSMPDDLLAMHVFVLTDRFDLSCFTRRVLAPRSGVRRQS